MTRKPGAKSRVNSPAKRRSKPRAARAAEPVNAPETFARLHFGDGRHYDRHMKGYAEDAKFYARYAARGKRVLDLGSGTGRIAIPMAKRGCAVTGVDFLPHMVRLAREKARRAGVRVRWVEGDVLTAPVPGRFDLVLAPFNFLAQFPRRKLPRVLARARRLLAPGGLLVLDLFNPGWRRPGPKKPYDMEYADVSGKGRVKLRITGRVQGGVSRVTHEYRLPSGKTRQDTLTLLAIKPAEFDRLLAKSGFRVVAKYGGFDRRPFTGIEAEHIVEAR